MGREIFCNDSAVDLERRVRWLRERIEKVERSGFEARQLMSELKKLESDLLRAA